MFLCDECIEFIFKVIGLNSQIEASVLSLSALHKTSHLKALTGSQFHVDTEKSIRIVCDSH